jgi:hypothetical protein
MMLTFLCLLSWVEDRVLIRPRSTWLDTSFDGRGHHRQVNQVLGKLLRLHYPRIMMKGAGRSEPATIYRDYARAPDAKYGDAQGVMRNTLWVSSHMFITSITSCNT